MSVAFFVSADDAATKQNIFQDSDQDGLSNDEEALYKTDPLLKDTDGDGYTDGVEVESGYDPLKPAPGDKLVTGTDENAATPSSAPAAAATNLTDQVSNEIATMVQGNTSEGKDITLDTINESVQKVLSQTDQEVVLPDVNMNDIKIKKLPKGLKEKQRKAQEKEDALQYLTVMAYIMANNSPKKFQTESDLGSIVSSMSMDALSAMTLGNSSYLDTLAKNGEKTLDEIKGVEVPEGMLDVHVKAMKMAKYSITLKDEMKSGGQQADPIGQIASLSKVQGFLGVVTEFSQELYQKLNDYGIQEIPLKM